MPIDEAATHPHDRVRLSVDNATPQRACRTHPKHIARFVLEVSDITVEVAIDVESVAAELITLQGRTMGHRRHARTWSLAVEGSGR